MAHPLGSKSLGRGRLGRKLGAAGGKGQAPVSNQRPSAKSLARWENEGGSAAPGTATSARAKKVEAASATKKSVAMHSAKKEKPKPGTSRVKNRR